MGIALAVPFAVLAQSLPVVQDAYVVPGNGTNFGASVNLTVGSSASQGLVQFDLSALPTGLTAAQVQKAALFLYVNHVNVGGTINVYVSNGSWAELTVNGTNAPAPGAVVASLVPVSSAGQYITVDATAAVQGWVTTPTTNNGFLISGNGSTSVQFDSKEASTTSHAAVLAITLAGAGPQGPAGATGPTGATGPQGPAGATGATGTQGPAGATGATGTQGPAGATGATGAQGPAGATGATGTQGPAGATGAQGPAGAPGATGATGAPGTNGTNGNTVLSGATAPVAATGNNGDFYLLTTTSCLYGPKAAGAWPVTCTNLVGPTGAAGATGATGATGSTGPAGPQGPTGPQGPPGTGGGGSTDVMQVSRSTSTPDPCPNGPQCSNPYALFMDTVDKAPTSSAMSFDLTNQLLHLNTAGSTYMLILTVTAAVPAGRVLDATLYLNSSPGPTGVQMIDTTWRAVLDGSTPGNNRTAWGVITPSTAVTVSVGWSYPVVGSYISSTSTRLMVLKLN